MSYRRLAWRLSGLALVLVLGARTGHSAAAPCVSATAECAEFVTVGNGPSRLQVYRSAPLTVRDDAVTHALVVIQGAERSAATSFRIAAAAAVLRGRIGSTLVVAPRFAARVGTACTDELAPNELNWQCDVQLGDWRSGGAALIDATLSSFDALDALLLRISAPEAFPNLRTVVVAGHSAGGQFVTNYQMTNRVHERLRVSPTYVTANASAYAYPDSDRPVAGGLKECPTYADWPFGIVSRVGYAARLTGGEITEQAAKRPINYLVGDQDVQPLDGGFYGSCAAAAQGATRFARGVFFARHMTDRHETGRPAVVVPGCAHSESCMFLSRTGLDALFP